MYAGKLDSIGRLKKWIHKRIRGREKMTYSQLAYYDMIDRPHYAYCVYGAADLALRLGLDKVSIIEFGVAGGNGLVALEAIIEDLKRSSGIDIEFEVFGFDTGKGMPPPEGVEDLPYWFAEGQYVMDHDKLNARLKKAKTVIGNIRETAPSFHVDMPHAPIGAMMIDVDYYSSMNDCLKIFQTDDLKSNFLPRIHIYLDDVVGGPLEMYGPFNGMLKSLSEFNDNQDSIKIHKNRNLIGINHIHYREQIYYAHLFDHPEYSTYIGGELQDQMMGALKLRNRS